MIGQTVLHYKILEKLGEGGMGVVYKAEDTKLRRLVALKVLPDRVNKDTAAKERFLQEAQAAAALNHPNICTIHGVEDVDGSLFIVMEYVEGGTLREKLPFAKIDAAITIAAQIGEALQEAHSKGIVHRDIKADNIMLTSKGQAKVMDFGLAKLKGAMKLTKTSSTVGTIGYMAPEQIQGGEVDHRSDIFSFGVLLFEMLTGKLPFRGEHEAAMMYSILNEQAESIEKYLPDASPEFLHIFNRALEKDPEDRYQTIHDMVIDLRRLKKETSKVVRPTASVARPAEATYEDRKPSSSSIPKPGFFSRRGIMAALVLTLVAIISAVAYFLFFARSVTIVPNRIAVAVFENRTGDTALDGFGADIAQLVAQGLAGVDSVDAVQYDAGIRSWRTLASESSAGRFDLPQQFGRQLGAEYVVNGSYHKTQDSLQLSATVTDVRTGKLMRQVGPIACPLDNRQAGVEVLRQRLMGGIAVLIGWGLTERDIVSYVPRFDAYQKRMVGKVLFDRYQYDESIEYFRSAYRLDSTFFQPLFYEAWAHGNRGRRPQRDSVVALLERSRWRMKHPDNLLLDWFQSDAKGDYVGQLRVLRPLAARDPDNWGYLYGRAALFLNRQREAIDGLSKVKIERWDWVPIWDILTFSYHLLGEHNKELEAAKKARSQHPNSPSPYLYELRALSALGRTEEVWKLFDEYCAMPNSNPGDFLTTYASESYRHGYREESQRAKQKVIDWYLSRPDSVQQLPSWQSALAVTYYNAGEFGKAKSLFLKLKKRSPDDVNVSAMLGKIAARTGDTQEVGRTSEWLKNLNKSYLYGSHTYQRACIASLLGQKDEAMNLIRQALGEGIRYPALHTDTDLEPLWDYPPFQELIKPKEGI